MICADHVRSVLIYDPATGNFVWKNSNRPAGYIMTNGYRLIGIKRKYYLAQRLAHLYMTGAWPDADMDHVNGERADNRWVNLRPATRSQNLANAKRRKDNSTGFKGVSYYKSREKYEAYINLNGKRRKLGYFSTAEDAHAAYLMAARKLFGDFARSA